TLMEYLIQHHVPQRTAHHLVGELVRMAMERHVPLADLPVEEMSAKHPELDERVYDVLGVEKAVEAFVSYGSTSPSEVARQVADWKKRLDM
ncbi:MAG: argininosuccinate lyase, partial [Pirellulaceae bacterium]